MRRKLLTNDGRKVEEVCKELNIPFWSVYDRIRIHNQTPDEAVQYFVNKPAVHYRYNGKSLRQYCKEQGLSYTSIARFHRDFPKISLEDVITKRMWIKRPEPDTVWCKQHNIPYAAAKNRHRYHQIYNDEQRTFRQYCKDFYKL